MKMSLNEKNPGIGSRAGARPALTGSGFLSASLSGGGSVPHPELKDIDKTGFFRSNPEGRKMGRRTAKNLKRERSKRRPDVKGADVIAPEFLLCQPRNQLFCGTKTLFLLSDFISRSGSVPKAWLDPKMADNQNTVTPSEDTGFDPDTSKKSVPAFPPFNGFDSEDASTAVARLAELDATLGDEEQRRKVGQQGAGGFPLGALASSTPLAPSKVRGANPPLHPPRKKGDSKRKGTEVRAKTPAGSGKGTSGTGRTAPAGKVGPVKDPAPTTRKEQPRPLAKAKKRKAGESYAEVVKSAEVCYLREIGGKMLSSLDLIEFQDFLAELEMNHEEIDLNVTKAGYRDGCIWFGLQSKESVEWLRSQMYLLKPWNTEHTGYEFFGPGEAPFRVFFVQTSDKNALKDDRFLKLVQKKNKSVFGGTTNAIKILDSKPLPGNKPGLELKVAVDQGLVGELARLKFELFYGLGKVKFQKPLSQVKKVAKKSKKGIDDDGRRTVGEGQDDDDTMDHDGGVIDVDLEDSGDEDLGVNALFAPGGSQ